jgi:hypothetical protein
MRARGIFSVQRILAGAVATLLLTGCVSDVLVRDSEVRDEMSWQAAQIEIGATTRASVRAALGPPNWSHDGLRLDAYRMSDRQWKVVAGIAGVNPAPFAVPFAFPAWKNRFAYILITYDAN